MPAMKTYRNELPFGFCPGCSHRLVLEALDRALVRLQWDPASIVIVSDIGCVGLSDQYFVTSRFHGLHGRSLTYATGIKLAHPDLHVINLIGDGGCGIGCTHLVSAARRNVGVATLVFNNLNFGMTGGEHSVTTPTHQKTTTTPWGNPEHPLDIAQTVAVNGATYVWRGTVFEPGLDDHIETALKHDGFALLDIWELCVAYYAAANKVSPQELSATMARMGMTSGVIQHSTRTEGTAALREAWKVLRGQPPALSKPLDVRFTSDLNRTFGLIIAGDAGAHVRTAGHLVGTAATMSNLWTAQRDDYPVTVRSGHSISDVVIAPEPVHYTGITRPDALFILSASGYKKVSDWVGRISDGGWLFVVPDLADRVSTQLAGLAAERLSPPRIRVLHLDALEGVTRSTRSLAAVAAGLAYANILEPAALIEAAARLGDTHAHANQEAVRSALGSIDAVVSLAS